MYSDFSALIWPHVRLNELISLYIFGSQTLLWDLRVHVEGVMCYSFLAVSALILDACTHNSGPSIVLHSKNIPPKSSLHADFDAFCSIFLILCIALPNFLLAFEWKQMSFSILQHSSKENIKNAYRTKADKLEKKEVGLDFISIVFLTRK